MNLSSLVYFVTVADCGSFTKASRQLYVTQPALSRQIAMLEDELGEQLFVRKSKSIELTPAGEACLKEARDIVGHCNALRSRAHWSGGEIELAYSSGMNVVADVLECFYSRYGDIHIRMDCVRPGKLPTLLLEGKADFVIALDMALQNISDIEMVPLLEEEIYVVVPENHALAGRDTVGMKELSKEKFVMGERSIGSEGVDYTIELCVEAGFRPDAACYVDDIQSAMYMVSAGRGVAVAPSYAGNFSVPGIRLLHISDEVRPVWLMLACRADNVNPLVSSLMDEVWKRRKTV